MHEHRHRVLRRSLKIVLAAGILAIVGADVSPVKANAPPCRYTILPDTVLDNDTGLTWQRDGSSSGALSWDNAKLHCNYLSLDGGGWRLPSARELQTIVDDSEGAPTIDSNAFPGTPSDSFWSSSACAGYPGNAWSVNFDYGGVNATGVNLTLSVRCVR